VPLQAYASTGIRSDHESSTADEARAKAALGMLIQIREGSTARNLDAILPALTAGDLGDFWTLVTDDIFPTDLRDRGHIDGHLRRVLAAGVPLADAIRHATLIPARHYGLFDRGAVAPGYRADLVVLADPATMRVSMVLKRGRVVARDGQYVADVAAPPIAHGNTVHLAPIDESAFLLPLSSDTAPDAIGCWEWNPAQDAVMIASIERHRATRSIGRGLVGGFKLDRHGALGSSVAHDSHNLVVAGTNSADMLACVRALEKSGGGFVVASGGQVVAELPLAIAGLISTEPAEVVCRQLEAVNAAARALGCPLSAPLGTLSFLALPVIPELRITDQGLFDVVGQRFVML
jgi:adenine deaminase